MTSGYREGQAHALEMAWLDVRAVDREAYEDDEMRLSWKPRAEHSRSKLDG